MHQKKISQKFSTTKLRCSYVVQRDFFLCSFANMRARTVTLYIARKHCESEQTAHEHAHCSWAIKVLGKYSKVANFCCTRKSSHAPSDFHASRSVFAFLFLYWIPLSFRLGIANVYLSTLYLRNKRGKAISHRNVVAWPAQKFGGGQNCLGAKCLILG